MASRELSTTAMVRQLWAAAMVGEHRAAAMAKRASRGPPRPRLGAHHQPRSPPPRSSRLARDTVAAGGLRRRWWSCPAMTTAQRSSAATRSRCTSSRAATSWRGGGARAAAPALERMWWLSCLRCPPLQPSSGVAHHSDGWLRALPPRALATGCARRHPRAVHPLTSSSALVDLLCAASREAHHQRPPG
ncbi:unnamed protein product [Urochloa humidicola]